MKNEKLRILLIDDSKLRVVELVDFINASYDHNIKIEIAQNTDEAIEKETKATFDIIILDLNLPDRDDGANNFGGKKIINHLSEIGIFIKEKTIYLTSTEKTKQENIDIIDLDYFILYDENSMTSLENIKTKIDDKITSLDLMHKINAKQYDIVLITALKEELDISKDAISLKWKELRLSGDNNIYHTTKIKSTREKNEVSIIAAHAHKMGMATSAVLSTKMLLKFQPKMIVMLGICAGNSKDVKLGEIFIANKIFDYQSGKIILERNSKDESVQVFSAEYDERQIHPLYGQIFENIKAEFSHDIRKEWVNLNPYNNEEEKNLPRVHIDSMATGSAVISDETVFEKIKEHSRKVKALDMEGYSIFVAANSINQNVVPLVIKGIQDYANDKKDDSYRKYAIYTSARFFLKACEHSLIDELSK